MTGLIRGVATAMVTPFTDDGVNFDEFGKMIEYQIAGGVDALVVLGTTGEPATMTEAERAETIAYAVKKAKGRIKIIIGTGSNDTKKAVAATVAAKEAGADGALAVTPYYNKCTQKGIYEYYRAVCSAADIPVIAYNVPSRTGVNILPETAEKLSHIPNLAGIKEASGNMAQVCRTAKVLGGRCDLYSGEDILNFPILCVGGTGVISVVSNLAPALVSKMCALALSGDIAGAREVHERLLPLADACFTEVNPIPVKAGYNLLGFKAGTPRSPLTEIEDENREILKSAMIKAGLLNG